MRTNIVYELMKYNELSYLSTLQKKSFLKNIRTLTQLWHHFSRYSVQSNII